MAFFIQSNQIISRGVVPTRARITRPSWRAFAHTLRRAHAGADNSVAITASLTEDTSCPRGRG